MDAGTDSRETAQQELRLATMTVDRARVLYMEAVREGRSSRAKRLNKPRTVADKEEIDRRDIAPKLGRKINYDVTKAGLTKLVEAKGAVVRHRSHEPIDRMWPAGTGIRRERTLGAGAAGVSTGISLDDMSWGMSQSRIGSGGIRTPTIGAGFARALFDFAVATGAARSALVARTRLDDHVLEDPDARIALADYLGLMRAAKELTGDPALALHFGEKIDPTDLSIVALLGQNFETGAESLAELNRFSPLAIDLDTSGRDRIEIIRRGRQTWFVDRRSNPNASPELTESSFARIVCESRRRGLDVVKEVRFTHPAPHYRSEYERIFKVPMQFDCDCNALRVDEAAMTVRMGPQPAYVRGLVLQRAQTLLADLHTSKSTRGQVERLLGRNLADGDLTIEKIATELGVSRRTLYRRLKREGVTFELVLNSLRCELALSHLEDRTLTIGDIADRLGFSDRAAFSRAFKRWTGRSPQAERGGALRPTERREM